MKSRIHLGFPFRISSSSYSTLTKFRDDVNNIFAAATYVQEKDHSSFRKLHALLASILSKQRKNNISVRSSALHRNCRRSITV